MAPPKTFKGGDPKKNSKGNADSKKPKVPPTASERKRRQQCHVAANVSKDAEVQCDDPNNIGKDKEKGKVVEAENDNNVEKGAELEDGERSIVDKEVEVHVDNQNNVDNSKEAEVVNELESAENNIVDKVLEVEGDNQNNIDQANDGKANDRNNTDKAGHCEQENDECSEESEKSESDEGSSENEDDGEDDSAADGSNDVNEERTGKKNGNAVSDVSKPREKQTAQLRVEVKLDFSQSKLYQSFNSHVASRLLRAKVKDRGPLSCKKHTRKLQSWVLENEHSSVIELVKKSPLYCLIGRSYKAANRVLISAFVERSHAETNTFHMAFAEMGISLDDVHQITGLPITGKNMAAIHSSSAKKENLEDFVERVLGIPAKDVLEEFEASNSKSVKYEFLRKNLSGKAPDTYTAEQVARGYLLFLLGCTIFQDKTGNKVHIKYLYYLEHWNEIEKWAWGAAALAYLYRELGKASRLGTKTISGYLTLVEAWVYEHFPKYRPHKSLKLDKNQPRTAQWKPKSQYNIQESRKQLHYLRINLDGLTKKDVVWTPYRGAGESPPEVVWFTGPLKIHDIVEPHQPDRIVRQFGHIQDVPRDPLAPSRVSNGGKKAMSYAPQFVGLADEFDRWNDHVINNKFRGERMKKIGECTKEYDEWVKENCICRLDYSVKDPLAHVIENEEVDENTFKAWQILEKIFARKNARKEELFAAIGLAKELIKPKNQTPTEVETSDVGDGKRRSKRQLTTATTQKKQATATKERKRKKS